MSFQLSAQAITAQTAITRMPVRRCSTLPPQRGSTTAPKCPTSRSMAMLGSPTSGKKIIPGRATHRRAGFAAAGGALAAGPPGRGGRRQQLRGAGASRRGAPACGRGHPAPARRAPVRGAAAADAAHDRAPAPGRRAPPDARAPPGRRLTVAGWYGGGDRLVEICTGTALRHHPGLPVVPLRWVLVRDPLGEFRPQAFLCTDLDAEPDDILSWFVRRWATEVVFPQMTKADVFAVR